MVREDEHPYAGARLVGDLAFVSGALSVDPDGQPVRGQRAALDASMERLAERLASVGLALSNVVATTYYVNNLDLRREANAQFLRIFRPPRPTRTFVEVSRLPYDADVEISAVAAVRVRE